MKKIFVLLATSMLVLSASAEVKLDPQAQMYFTDLRPVDGLFEALLIVPSDNPFEQSLYLIKDNPRTPGIDQYELIAENAECMQIGYDSRLRCVYTDYDQTKIVTVFATTGGETGQYLVAYSKEPGEEKVTLLDMDNAIFTADQDRISRLLAE